MIIFKLTFQIMKGKILRFPLLSMGKLASYVL